MEPTVLPPAAHPVVPSKLYLCIHTVSAITAKVPLAMIVLSDCIKRKSLPPTLKCRVVRKGRPARAPGTHVRARLRAAAAGPVGAEDLTRPRRGRWCRRPA